MIGNENKFTAVVNIELNSNGTRLHSKRRRRKSVRGTNSSVR